MLHHVNEAHRHRANETTDLLLLNYNVTVDFRTIQIYLVDRECISYPFSEIVLLIGVENKHI